jgi:hypothetical protein
MWNAAVWQLSNSGLAILDGVQRKIGRMLLGFGPRSPSPAVIIELGWVSWSSLMFGERVRLCQRLLSSKCSYTEWIVKASAGVGESWLQEFGQSCSVWCEGSIIYSSNCQRMEKGV